MAKPASDTVKLLENSRPKRERTRTPRGESYHNDKIQKRYMSHLISSDKKNTVASSKSDNVERIKDNSAMSQTICVEDRNLKCSTDSVNNSSLCCSEGVLCCHKASEWLMSDYLEKTVTLDAYQKLSSPISTDDFSDIQKSCTTDAAGVHQHNEVGDNFCMTEHCEQRPSRKQRLKNAQKILSNNKESPQSTKNGLRLGKEKKLPKRCIIQGKGIEICSSVDQSASSFIVNKFSMPRNVNKIVNNESSKAKIGSTTRKQRGAGSVELVGKTVSVTNFHQPLQTNCLISEGILNNKCTESMMKSQRRISNNLRYDDFENDEAESTKFCAQRRRVKKCLGKKPTREHFSCAAKVDVIKDMSESIKSVNNEKEDEKVDAADEQRQVQRPDRKEASPSSSSSSSKPASSVMDNCKIAESCGSENLTVTSSSKETHGTVTTSRRKKCRSDNMNVMQSSDKSGISSHCTAGRKKIGRPSKYVFEKNNFEGQQFLVSVFNVLFI